MSDQFTEVTSEGWGQRIGGGFVALLFGLVLLPVSVGVLYWNEGRAVTAATALGHAAAAIIEANPAAVDQLNDGKLVHLTGTMQAATPARDPLFGVSADGLLRLTRNVETYQWQETSSSHSEQSLGGTKTTETTYSYQPKWSAQTINSASFKHPEGHQNPPPLLSAASFDGGTVTIGAYHVDPSVLTKISAFTPLHPANAAPPADYRAEGDGFYRGQNPAQPAIGDVKVSFSAVPAQTISVAAAQSGGTLTAYRDPSNYTIALAEPGVVSASALFQDAKHAESQITWIVRGAGFVAVLVGFICLTRPLTMLFAVVPFLESLVGAGAFLLALTLAVPVTLVTIAIAWMAHRPLLGGGLLAAALVALVGLQRLHPRRAAPCEPSGYTRKRFCIAIKQRISRVGSILPNAIKSGSCHTVKKVVLF